ncbi:MAG: group II intron reverse transcriptase/maturase [Polyangia bacterium]
MTTGKTPMDEWKTIPWKRIERDVFKLQKRIYRASQQNDRKKVHKLQRLLMRSRSGRLLAVRRVTQDNQGKKTAGIDGVKSLTPKQRLNLSRTLKIEGKARPVRRVEIPKRGSTETRPLGIPTLADRALQALVKQALEPEWEARFEANSYGFRPGRSCQDAIFAIFTSINQQPKWCLNADIAKCFDRIAHEPLLEKMQTSPTLRRQVRAWLAAGVMDHGELFPTVAGTPQGGCISPLLANIALHGLETDLLRHVRVKKGKTLCLIRYADDFVVLHRDRAVIEQCQRFITGWLKPMGLELKASKTRVTHTLEAEDGAPGFDFLGFNIRQYPSGKTRCARSSYGKRLGFKTLIKPSKQSIQRHIETLRQTLRTHRGCDQELLIKLLRPKIVGWCNYFAAWRSAEVFSKLTAVLFGMLLAWAGRRHSHKTKRWVAAKYWRVDDRGGWRFQPPEGGSGLPKHSDTLKKWYVKVQGTRSPFDGDWLYWSTRLGREPTVPARVARLLREQQGRCRECGLFFRPDDQMEVDHVIPRAHGGKGARGNLQLLHRCCHDRKTARDRKVRMTSATSSRSRVTGNCHARF